MSNALLKTNANDEQVAIALNDFQDRLSSYKGNISALLRVKNIDPEQFMVSVMNSVTRMPKLLECEVGSLLGAVLAAAELGLEPNTPFGLSHIIPYNNNKGTKDAPKWVSEAQFQIGYLGWLELFGRHPKIKNVDFQLVHQNDIFKQTMGANPSLIHEPEIDPTKKGARIGAYAIAWQKDVDNPVWAFVHASEITQIKSKSKGSDSKYSPWDPANDPMGWMWMKVAIKQLAKKLPKTREIEISIYAEDAADQGKAITIDQNSQTIKLDPISDTEELNRNKTDEKSKNAVSGAAAMLNKPKDAQLKEDVKKALQFFKNIEISETQILTKLELSHIDEIGLDHLTILRDVSQSGKKGIDTFFGINGQK